MRELTAQIRQGTWGPASDLIWYLSRAINATGPRGPTGPF
jgi:hypothetical protein